MPHFAYFLIQLHAVWFSSLSRLGKGKKNNDFVLDCNEFVIDFVPHFMPNFRDIARGVAELNAAHRLPERGNENKRYHASKWASNT